MATQPTTARAGWRERSTVQMLATLFSVVFVLVGIVGFIPGLTTNLYDGLEFAGDDGDAEILGLFHTASCTTSCTCSSGSSVSLWRERGAARAHS
jgi:uncharacterized protein DUF4383